ncbi:MAG TPA: ATP-grasp domain-containing protein [Ruminococcus sp.]|nr:ATP-grasp domain-containing protein [Ruminococcus sp.]
MKKLLILGANPETVSLIKKAKEMGIYTIVTDYDPNAFAKRFADQPENVNAVDVDGLVDLAKREKVDGVVVGVAEALLPTYCEVCKRLGMPAYSTPEVFEVMIRKDYFKTKCREYGVPTIREFDPNNLDDVVYPVIVKPVDSCSSKGIRVCKNREELDAAIAYALEFSRSKKYLIEEYMCGDEVISYYVMQDGNPIFVGMCDRYTYKAREELVQLPTSYIFPSRHIDSYMQHSDNAVKAMIKGLGLNNGSIFFQCFVDKEGIVRTYEPGYRLNGAQEHLIVSKVSGIDAKEMYINYALSGKVADVDLEPLSNPKPEEISCKLSPLVRLGKISKIEGIDEISKMPEVVSINPSYNEGDTVTGEGTLKQIVCRFFIVSQDKQSLKKAIDLIQTKLKVLDENGENMLIGLFDTDTITNLY